MKKLPEFLKNIVISCAILVMCLVLCQLIQVLFNDNALIPAMFGLAVFLISLITSGYTYGIISALFSVLTVNFAFTVPFFTFDFTIPENIISAIILLIITVVTCGLMERIKHQEVIKAESERERMRANLLRAVSHDLRTPLTTIYGSSSALLENYGLFSEEQSKMMLAGIKEEADWLNRMVENLLSVTRLDGDDVSIIKTETVVDELIDSVLVKFAKRYPDQEVRLDIPSDFLSVPMDTMLIQQVLINLLENAVRHATGMTRLWLKVYTISKKVYFEVRDNGCGIPPERLRDIFSGYMNQGATPVDGKNNAGIGLSVCAAIIRAHGGEIRAQNVRGGGSAFRFYLKQEDKNE
ncbi:MAG: PAS domain-containing sensor histidine kinase [Ruminococcaceae bacterium]|nr:PAS domain-containing sensor histidine kinase [Oscillospiraceae bacterium]